MSQSVSGAGITVATWMVVYNNNYTNLIYLYSILTGAQDSNNVIKNHTTVDILFNNAKAYDLTSAANVPKKVYTNSLVSTVANQKALYIDTNASSVHTSIPYIATTAGGVGTYTRKWGLIATVDLTKLSYGETARIDVDTWVALTSAPYLSQQF
ncbi:MAG: hypothetical protein EZS28_043163, partial [Streblomastix strix]